MQTRTETYAANRARLRSARLVVEMTPDEVDTVDRWGAEAGFPSRSAAVRHLLKAALSAQPALEAAE